MSAALRLRPLARGLSLPLKSVRPLRLSVPRNQTPLQTLRSRLPALTSTSTSTSTPRYFSNTSAPPPPPEVTIDGKPYKTDAWFNTPPNVIAAAGRRLHLQPDHPIAITRQIIESKFPAPTYKYHNSLHPVVSTFQNFDSLGFAADHPGRSRSDTYYVNKSTLLRTHTSAHELEVFRENASKGYLLSADVYRRDEVDRTHYPVFHQMEGARVWDRKTEGDANGDLAAAILADVEKLPTHDVPVEDAGPAFHAGNPRQEEAGHSAAEVEALGKHLKRSLELMVVEVFTRAQAASDSESKEALKMRWVEAFFPFTSPSWELEVLYEGEWLEVLGCGISQQHILNAAGVPSQIGWAFGIGLDRIAMLLFQITDIRLFWSRDERFLEQFRGVSEDLTKLKRFVSFSKHPACYKDVSFWLPSDEAEAEASTVKGEHSDGHNDVMEVIRSVAGDWVEDVKLIDSFTHPKTKRQSRCYRINYRSLERTLTNVETNEKQAEVVEALASRLGVTIR